MKGQKIAALIIIHCCLLLFVTIMPSCSRTEQTRQTKINEQEAFHQALSKAVFFEDRNPDSSLIFTTKALDLIHHLRFQSNDTLYTLLELKSNILSQNNQPDSALRLLSDARLAKNTTDDRLFQAKIALQLGFLEHTFNKHDLSEKHLLESIVLLEELDDNALKATAYNRYGNLLMFKSENNKALEYQLKAFKILESLNNAPELCNVCLSIGNIFNAIGSRDEELRYTLLGMNAALVTHDKGCEIAILNNLGVYYRHQNPDSARYYYQRIIALSTPANSDNVLSARYNIANLYFDQKKYDQALIVYNEILEQCLAEKLYVGVASAYSGIASANNRKGNYGKAIEFCKIALQYADSTGEKALMNRLKNNLHIYYKNNGNFKDAYFTAMEIKAFNDSTQALEKKVAIHELEIRYQTEKREAENKKLNLEFENEKLVSKSRAYIIILLFLIALLLMFILWKGYALYRERSFAYNVLMKKYEVERVHREMVGVLQQDFANQENTGVLQSSEDALIESLNHYYLHEKPYLDPKLKVEDVAAKLNTTQKAIASALKQYNNSNFNTFTNQFRVDEAKMIMENLSDKFYKVETVAYDSGFGSRSSFYLAFEQFTGIKPSYYRSFMLSRKEEIA